MARFDNEDNDQFELLLVDDNDLYLDAMGRYLDQKGYRITLADNGLSAVELLGNKYYDLVITDLYMKQVNGIDVLKKTKSLSRDTKVIILTGYSDFDSAINAMRHNVDDFILKGGEMEELFFRVNRCLEELKLERKVKEQELVLQKHQEELENIIEERTAALKKVNERLLLESHRRRGLSKRLIELLEMDRQNVARELHDEVGQTLTSLKLTLEIMKGLGFDDSEKLISLISSAEMKASKAIRDLKNISYGLRPALLDSMGLIPAIRELINDIKRQTEVEFDFFHMDVPTKFDADKELTIYRIVQEATNNAIKHGNPESIHVTLLVNDDNILLTVEDDGKGFDPEIVIERQGDSKPLGLVIMRERTVQMDGEFTVESKTAAGTLIRVEIPMNERGSHEE